MNAYELAKYLATESPEAISYRFACGNAAIMLRQQADRIAELENVSSKPVAEVIEWEETYGHTFKKRTVSTVKWLENVEVGTKLYTHPVKQLSDADIQRISYKYHYTYNPDYVGFARAIIKEIQND